MSAKYAFIAAEKATRNTDGSARYTVVLMCTWLAVSTSGFYAGPRKSRVSAVQGACDGSFGVACVVA